MARRLSDVIRQILETPSVEASQSPHYDWAGPITYKNMRELDASRKKNPNYDGAVADSEVMRSVRDALSIWPVRRAVSYEAYERGKQRYGLVAAELANYLSDTILDVGSRDDTLSVISGRPCELVDKHNPDLPDFDWERERLPYNDETFDTVVCLDTLEHLNCPHDRFDDLLRVSRGNVIVSLPNCWRNTVLELLTASGRQSSYGLPCETPKDRHQWFFNTEEALNFIVYRGLRSPHDYDLDSVRLHAPARRWWQRLFYPVIQKVLPRYFLNLLVRTVFVVLVRR